MEFLETVVESIRGDDGDADTFGYRCLDCGTEFAHDRTRMIEVRCPDCGSPRVEPTD